MINISFIAISLAVVYSLALICALRVLLSSRTPQGAIAWIVALLSFPFVTLILYALFGRNRFSGYVRARRTGDREVAHFVESMEASLADARRGAPEHAPELSVLSQLVRLPVTGNNHCQLLHNGNETFEALFRALEEAQDYILLEFYIVRSDRIGRQIQSILLRKRKEGVRVHFIYDEIGSAGLDSDYRDTLTAAGAQVQAFGAGNSRRRRFQINFRNHRKLLVCDGRVGFVGGLNLGDEYAGTAADRPAWRDTHCRVEGPAVRALQLVFLEDWYWITNQVPAMDWSTYGSAEGNHNLLILPTGPADRFETCTLFFLNCINSARERIWIASPYFVPDQEIVNALQLASLRGVDVRIIIPQNPDHRLVRMAAYSYLIQADRSGIGIYHYQPGFMHQKILLVDDRYASVGTANLDNRSMRLNFEVNLINTEPDFVAEVAAMLAQDLAQCKRLTSEDYRNRSWGFRIMCRAIRLAAPLL